MAWVDTSFEFTVMRTRVSMRERLKGPLCRIATLLVPSSGWTSTNAHRKPGAFYSHSVTGQCDIIMRVSSMSMQARPVRYCIELHVTATWAPLKTEQIQPQHVDHQIGLLKRPGVCIGGEWSCYIIVGKVDRCHRRCVYLLLLNV